MKPLLILKLGDTFPALARRHGDFELWIRSHIGRIPASLTVLDPRRQPLPDPLAFSAMILTGSHDMVTDRLPWSEQVAAWLPKVVAADVPLLGICYGHQLIAHAFGGHVGPMPAGREFGTVELHLHTPAHTDPLFRHMPSPFPVQTSHAQSVLQLPPRAVSLASTAHDPNSAFALPGRVWGVQFHPEYDVHTVRTYIEACAAELRSQGADPASLLAATADTPHSRSLLPRFAALALDSAAHS
jgi:GMP synthase (glutamine-hydrolysing)